MNDEQFATMMTEMRVAHNQAAMWTSNGTPMFDDPQEIANRAWKQLAAELGFVWDSVEPGSDIRNFTAIPVGEGKQ